LQYKKEMKDFQRDVKLEFERASSIMKRIDKIERIVGTINNNTRKQRGMN